MSGERPDISIVIPTFNAAAFLIDAVESVEAQGINAEIIVVDDGSTDGTAELCDRLVPRIRHFSQPNRGPAAARNAGLKRCSSDVIAFLDADDAWRVGSIEDLLRVLSANVDVDVVVGMIQLMVRPSPKSAFMPFRDPFFSYSLPAALFRRRAFDVTGAFDTRLIHGEDVDWFMRAREHGLDVALRSTVVLEYRRHGENLTFGQQGDARTLLRMMKASIDRRRNGRELIQLDSHRVIDD
jgi:glycosyltransferase involved in cell wall biosynthesis